MSVIDISGGRLSEVASCGGRVRENETKTGRRRMSRLLLSRDGVVVIVYIVHPYIRMYTYTHLFDVPFHHRTNRIACRHIAGVFAQQQT